jgi:hypothetical protein
MPRSLRFASALGLYVAIMASVIQSVTRWVPLSGSRSDEQIAAEALTILAFGVIAAIIVHRFWLRPRVERKEDGWI